MSQVSSGVLQKLQDILPGQIGSNLRWSTTDVERYTMLADRAVRERVDNLYHEQEIVLTEDTLEYTLDSEFIDIVTVEFSSDGSTYDRYLNPGTLDDLDNKTISWRDSGGTRPEFYTLLSAPGCPESKILIWRPMISVDSQTIKVIGHGVGTTTTYVADDIQGKCYVPYVMALLKAKSTPQEAFKWFGQYVDGCSTIRGRTVSRHS